MEAAFQKQQCKWPQLQKSMMQRMQRVQPVAVFRGTQCRHALRGRSLHCRGGSRLSSCTFALPHDSQLSPEAATQDRLSGADVENAEAGPSSTPEQHSWSLASAALHQKDPSSAMKLFSLFALTGGVMGSGFNFEGPLSQIQAVAVLALIVAVHETGHFLAARLQVPRTSLYVPYCTHAAAIPFAPLLFMPLQQCQPRPHCLFVDFIWWEPI